MITKRVSRIEPSATLAISALAKQMRKEGKDVKSFSAGEPDFRVPDHIQKAAIDAIKENFSYYTPANGTEELRKAISEKLKRENRTEYDPSQIVVSNGGKHALNNTYQALLEPGDEAILIAPYWVSYAEQIKLAEGKPVIVESNGDFEIDTDVLRDSITEKTRLITLNSPSNPTGTVLTSKQLRKVKDIALENNLYVISDEVYEHFLYDGEETASISSMGEEIKGRTIIINAISKTYSMTGWRIGWSASEDEIAKGITAMQSHMTSNPNSIAQKAALAAYNGDQTPVRVMRDAFDKRRRYIVKRLNSIEGITSKMPKGAFYVFPDISLIEKDSLKFCKDLLEEEKVAVVPGTAFGREGHIRISYSSSIEDIEEGMDRLERFVKRSIKKNR